MIQQTEKRFIVSRTHRNGQAESLFHRPCRAVLNSLLLQGNSLCSNFKFNHGEWLQHASFSKEGGWYKVEVYKKIKAKQLIAKCAPIPEGIVFFWALSSFYLLHLLLPWPCSLTHQGETAGPRWMCPQRTVTQMSCPSASPTLKRGVLAQGSAVWRMCFPHQLPLSSKPSTQVSILGTSGKVHLTMVFH